MFDPPIHGANRFVSASLLTDTMAEALACIKDQDSMTDAELGAVLHRSGDQAAKYRTGLAEMGSIAFLRALERWNGRFSAPVLDLIGFKMSRVTSPAKTGRGFASLLARLQAAVNAALEDDNEIDDDEWRAMRALLDEVGHEIDGRLSKPGLRVAK